MQRWEINVIWNIFVAKQKIRSNLFYFIIKQINKEMLCYKCQGKYPKDKQVKIFKIAKRFERKKALVVSFLKK